MSVMKGDVSPERVWFTNCGPKRATYSDAGVSGPACQA